MNMHSTARKTKGGFVLKLGFASVAVAAIGGAFWLSRAGDDAHYTTFEVRRGPLDVRVLEGGNVEALESQEIKSRVKGWQGVKILFIVEEGYFVTEEDVKNKKKLVELDGSELQEKLTTSQISFKGTQASLTEAEKGYDIQINQSESDIFGAELETKFAQLEMKKFLGREVSALVLKAIEETEAEREAQRAAQLPEEGTDEEAAGGGEDIKEVPLEDLRLAHPDITYSEFAHMDKLGNGEASQTLRKLEDEFMLAKADDSQALTEFQGKKRLFDKNFITKNELKNAEIKKSKQEVSVKTAETAKQLFIEYEFPKQAEKLVSDYIQAKRKLERTEQQALSKIAQAQAKLLSAQARYKIEGERIKEYEEQIGMCIMVAERAGLVVYGGSGPRYWDAEPIKEGATIREKQAIITIPDMSKMAAKVNIHETDIKKIVPGQRAVVRVDAYPDRELDGEVVKVGVLPEAENRWINPDLKVYETTVRIEGTHEWLKPGMSAEVDILVKRLDDATYIPIQSVVPRGNTQVCFVIENGAPVARVIETEDITVEYIVVTSGLKKGERVLIRPPEGSRREESDEEDATEEDATEEDATEDDATEDEEQREEEDVEGEVQRITRTGAGHEG